MFKSEWTLLPGGRERSGSTADGREHTAQPMKGGRHQGSEATHQDPTETAGAGTPEGLVRSPSVPQRTRTTTWEGRQPQRTEQTPLWKTGETLQQGPPSHCHMGSVTCMVPPTAPQVTGHPARPSLEAQLPQVCTQHPTLAPGEQEPAPLHQQQLEIKTHTHTHTR